MMDYDLDDVIFHKEVPNDVDLKASVNDTAGGNLY